MNFCSFHLLPKKREGISFPTDGALEGSKRKAKQRVPFWLSQISKTTRKVSAIANKSLWIHMRSRFRREALSGLDRITNVESKSLSTHTHAHNKGEREREIFS